MHQARGTAARRVDNLDIEPRLPPGPAQFYLISMAFGLSGT